MYISMFDVFQTSTVSQVDLSKMTHFDKMAALVHRKFNTLVASIGDNFAGRKVVAGLVMKMSEGDIGTVIAIGSGKYLGNRYLILQL